MKQARRSEVIEARVTAYRDAVKAGYVEFGGSGSRRPALEVAAQFLGLKSAGLILAALRSSGAGDIAAADRARQDERRRRARMKESRARRAAEAKERETLSQARVPSGPVAKVPAKRSKRAAVAKSRKRRKTVAPAAPERIIVGTRYVEDPISGGAPIKAQVNLAQQPAELLRGRRVIDDVQYRAARSFRAAYEDATSSPIRGIDPSREHVDGGKFAVDVPLGGDGRALRRYRDATTEVGYAVLVAVVGRGDALAEIIAMYAQVRGSLDGEKGTRGYILRTLVDALDDVAVADGLRAPRERVANQFVQMIGVDVRESATERAVKSVAAV